MRTSARNGFVLPEACNFIKKEALAEVFSCEFCEISKNTFSTERLRVTASKTYYQFGKFIVLYSRIVSLSFSFNNCSYFVLPVYILLKV